MRRSMQLKAAHACLRYHRRRSSDAGMQASFDHAHSCRLLRDEWREIASAPFDREIEAATIDGCIITSAGLMPASLQRLARCRNAEAGRCNRHALALQAADEAADQLLLMGGRHG